MYVGIPGVRVRKGPLDRQYYAIHLHICTYVCSTCVLHIIRRYVEVGTQIHMLKLHFALKPSILGNGYICKVINPALFTTKCIKLLYVYIFSRKKHDTNPLLTALLPHFFVPNKCASCVAAQQNFLSYFPRDRNPDTYVHLLNPSIPWFQLPLHCVGPYLLVPRVFTDLNRYTHTLKLVFFV